MKLLAKKDVTREFNAVVSMIEEMTIAVTNAHNGVAALPAADKTLYANALMLALSTAKDYDAVMFRQMIAVLEGALPTESDPAFANSTPVSIEELKARLSVAGKASARFYGYIAGLKHNTKMSLLKLAKAKARTATGNELAVYAGLIPVIKAMS